MNKKQKGFTLFELLVSISIIGILTALGVVSFSNAQKKARDSRRIQDMDAIQKAAEQFYSTNAYTYPANPAAFVPNNFQVFPSDPKNDATYFYTYSGPVGTTYCAWVKMENSGVGNCNQAAGTCASITYVASGGSHYCIKNQQ